MTTIIQLLETTLNKVLLAFAHNWIYLLVSILAGSLIKLFLDRERVAAYLQSHQKGGVVLATAVAVGTPLCSCGTTAIVIGMMVSMMPWAPIVAFMVSSPLSSPEGMLYTAGLFGWPFALAGFFASILLGLAGGWVAGLLEKSGWLQNQARLPFTHSTFPTQPVQPAILPEACGCQSIPQVLKTIPVSCGCQPAGDFQAVLLPAPALCECTPTMAAPSAGIPGSRSIRTVHTSRPHPTIRMIGQQLLQDAPRLLVMFFSFAFLGYLLNGLIPNSWITSLFGANHAYSVPLAATLGLPFYINSEASLPLVRAMLDSGMSQGAALAFLISGAGTSVGAIAGALAIARWRIIAIVVGTLWLGAMVAGFLYNLVPAGGLI